MTNPNSSNQDICFETFNLITEFQQDQAVWQSYVDKYPLAIAVLGDIVMDCNSKGIYDLDDPSAFVGIKIK